jgi:predicted methyltransferase
MMMKILNKALLTLIAGVLLSSVATADDFSATEEKIRAAMTADIRGESDTSRDQNRKPVETLEFFGLRDDMKIVELIAGGGWYTKILAPVMAENGEYYASVGTSRVKESLSDKPGFENMKIAVEDSSFNRPEGARLYELQVGDLGVTDADIVFTFRNYHNFNAESRAAMNKAVFSALKSGGVYAVVDHTKRHMEGDTDENRRRVDPVLAIKEIQDAGFRLVDYSALHYRADDELRYEVGRKSVTGNTDRFTLKFVKE